MTDAETEDMRPLEIRVETPGDTTELEARIAENEARFYPEAAPRRQLIIVGSGPSANDPRLWDYVRENPQLATCAVNGALKLFLERGLEPDYWTCCDPQDLTLPFIPDDAPLNTEYYLATKCHPALFDRLMGQGIVPRKWRLDDYATPSTGLQITCAVSIMLVSQNLFRMKGYTTFEMWGWDCCFLDDKHHAVEQPDVIGDRLTFEIQNEEGTPLAQFPTIGSWVAELHDACIQGHNFKSMGYEMIVHGPGAVGHLLGGKGLATHVP